MAKDIEGRQRGTEDSFTGRAAQLAVVAELLRLRCNAAIPEIDLGTDVFAFKEDREEVVRLQVKACMVPRSYVDGSGYSAMFAPPHEAVSPGGPAAALLRSRGVLGW